MINCTVLQGDCIEQMLTIPDQSVNCCVTSPPYFGLRDYGCDGQIGLEETPELYIAKMVDVFRGVRRVLRDDGALWVNIGDSYVGAMSERKEGSFGKQSCLSKGTQNSIPQNGRTSRGAALRQAGFKPKDLIGIPWMLAFALRADGWYLRQDIIWSKPNPMPESVKDRCTKAHEYVFLLSKSERYWYDFAAIKEPSIEPVRAREKHNGESAVDTKMRGYDCNCGNDGTRNKRSVWHVATKPYPEAHFATYPPELIEPCILAGCPIGGTVLDPFGGSGTTAEVAIRNGRNAVLCELNPEYIELIHKRVEPVVEQYNGGPLFANAEEIL